MKASRFSVYSFFLLLYTLAAVAWGVFVRASKSGDGCGQMWPLCDNGHTPFGGDFGRFVELSHRLSTSLIGIFAIIFLVWGFRIFPKGSLGRKSVVMFMAMTLFEGFIGFLLVRYQLVVLNESLLRAVVMAVHVISTFLMLGSAFVAMMVSMGVPGVKWRGQGAVGWILAASYFGITVLGISGAISALARQVKPVENVLATAADPGSHWLNRLQPFHPLIAASVGLFLLLAGGLIVHLRPDERVKKAVYWMLGIYAFQSIVGAMAIWLKTPIAMQMFHLVMADVSLLSIIGVTMFALGEGVERVELRPAPVAAQPEEPLHGRGLINAYVALTKPRVISLLLFTTMTTMVAATGRWPGWWPFLAVFVGGYLAAGAANAINMVIDRDIDYKMNRTAKRPTVTQSIPSKHAIYFALASAAISFGLIWSATYLLAAVMALSGLVFYVVVYTLLLKRRTWQNIVIGGAAGAFPPLVGWAAATGQLPPLAIALFGIIFVWTPVHFWALALLIKDDYAAAGVPMLPVVKGDRATVVQIGWYAVATVAVTLVPLLMPNVGWIYGVTAIFLNIVLIKKCIDLSRNIERPQASSLFHFSMLYLALLFLGLMADRSFLAFQSGGVF